MDAVPLCFLIVMSLLVMSLPRGRAIAPLLMTAVLMTIGPEINIGPAKFTVMRLVVIAGVIRVFIRGEGRDLVNGPIDRAFYWWSLVTVVMMLLPMPRDPRAVMAIRTMGDNALTAGRFVIDIGGMYFLARCFVRNTDDIRFGTRILIALAVIMGGFMMVEKLTARNLLFFLGGVGEFTVIRDGKLRCQGSFTHPIHAGTYGSTLLPLCLGLWIYGKRKLAAVGVVASTLMVIASSSSGPLMSWVSGCLAVALWPKREKMRLVRRLILFAFVVAELGMKGHAWWLIAKISDIVGGGGYWRAKLIDQFVNHFSEWWIQGTNYTAHWSPTGSGLPLYPDYMDITNQFVAEGVNGGLLKLVLYVSIIVACFKKAGRIANDGTAQRETQIIFWSLGCMVFAYCMSFLAVANSAQNSVIFLWLLACLSVVPKDSSPVVEATEGERERLVPSNSLSFGQAHRTSG